MEIRIFQVDAFTGKLFGGNPAAVCVMDDWPDTEVLLNIAKENNLAETAFCIRKDGEYSIRWFTPEIEMDLCGHATLATAHVLFREYGAEVEEIVFNSASGKLGVSKNGNLYTMNFPSRMPVPAELPEVIRRGIGRDPKEVFLSRDYVLVYDSQVDIEAIRPDRQLLDTINLDPGGIIVTARGEEADFVSRFFTPQASVFEDPVTGSAHCSLIPFWAERLGKDHLKAYQISERMGVLHCENRGDRVLIGGEAVTYLKGTITADLA